MRTSKNCSFPRCPFTNTLTAPSLLKQFIFVTSIAKNTCICYTNCMANTNRKAAIKKLKALIFNSRSDVNVYRAKIESLFKTVFLPNNVERQEKVFGGVTCDFLFPELYSSGRILFYVHGGCFVGGSRASYRNFCAMLANKAYSRTVVPEYRLAPSHPFPAATEDIQLAFRSLFTEEQIAHSLDSNTKNVRNALNTKTGETAAGVVKNATEESFVPEIIIAADGAGASIAMSLLLNLRERYRKCIKRVVFFSPWFDLSETSVLRSEKKVSDEVMNSDSYQKCGESYTFASNLVNPLVSPVYASKDLLKDFPPVYIQVGENELLLSDAKKMAGLLREAGSECDIDVWDDMPHLFQLADEYFDEAHDALRKVSTVISGIGALNERQTFENKPRLENSFHSEA